MKNKFISAIIIIAVLYSSKIYSQDLYSLKFQLLHSSNFHSAISQSYITKDLFTQIKPGLYSFNKFSYVNNKTSYLLMKITKDTIEKEGKSNPKAKSIWIGAGLSAVLPGAGEFYAKSYIKSAIFFVIEVAGWSAYAIYQHQGNKRTSDFENFANQNWDIHRYAQWLVDQGFKGASPINPQEPNWKTLQGEINQCESQNFSHTLSDFGTQQFYELIGKYQNFEAGWSDAINNGQWIVTINNYETYHTPIFDSYSHMRQIANDSYDHATTASMIVLANHILSAADAAWSVSLFNEKISVQTGLRIGTYLDPYTFQVKTQPTLNLQVNF